MSSFLSLTGLSPSLAGFPKTFLLGSTNQLCGPNPTVHAPWFGLFPFRSPLLWKSIFLSNERTCFFLFLRLLRCFSSPGSLPYVMDWRMDDWSSSSRVSPFRYLRLNGYLLLPAAFRSLSRLSSALSAKASTLRSFLLDLLTSCISQRWNTGSCVSKTRLVNFFTVLLWFIFSDVLIKIFYQSLYEVFKVPIVSASQSH